MSILKQVLKDAWSSVVRKPPSRKPPVTLSPPPPIQATQVRHLTPALARGLKVVILNWKAGENDPFTVVNKTIRHHLEVCGKNVEVIEITNADWPNQLKALAPVEFVLTWQGLGSAAKIAGSNESLWEHLKIPLICIHGDHPCHMPLNHELESPYCFHLYTNADFARYSNRHFRRTRSARVVDIPQLHREARLSHQRGDYFVVAKNINDPTLTERSWRDSMPKPMFEACMKAAETLKSRILQEPHVDIHDVLDELIADPKLDWLNQATNAAEYHDYHSRLDHYIRSHKTVSMVGALGDFPLRIYGRGWDRIAEYAPRTHLFEKGLQMAASQELYYSRFGIVDVSPSKGLHDRTRRAMVNEVGFLSSANLEDSFADIDRFDSLFFTFRPTDLERKAVAVVQDPEAHAALARDFARTYHDRFHFRLFVDCLDQLAKVATNTEASR